MTTSTDTPSLGACASPEVGQTENVKGLKEDVTQKADLELKEKMSKDEDKSIRKSVKLPVVKLDLESGTCDSVLAGIMHQPGKDKICTYQVNLTGNKFKKHSTG